MLNDRRSSVEADNLFANSHLVGQTNLVLQFSQVDYSCKTAKSKNFQILQNVSGCFRSGRLAAVLGPSGAGKTSLLNVLSGFKAKGVSGVFHLNNDKRDLLAFRKISSYIPQDFAMLDLLTVQETLKVSADLKLPTDTSRKQKDEIITDILQILNMEKCRQTLTRDLSGGERKRLSVGVELVNNPPVMFFDEPTSGLDSVASLQLMNYLRRLALDGRIIVCVVHQPSSRLMQLFDDVLVLSRGHMLYAGTQRDMLEHFERVGFKCPSFYNPADFVLEVASEEHDTRILNLINLNQARYCLETTTKDASLNEPQQQPIIQDHVVSDSPEYNDVMVKVTLPESSISIVQLNTHTEMLIRPKEHVSFTYQFYVLVCRSLRSMSRNLISVQLRVVMHVVVGFLLGVVFWNIGDDASKTLANSSCILFIILFVYFGNAMPSILLCPRETAVFLREYLNSWYSIRAYYAAKIVSDLPMQFACPSLFIAIVYFMTGQPMEVGRLVMCWGICFLAAFIGHFIGLVFGSTFDLQMSVFLVPSITIPFLIFSGFFIRIHELSYILRPLCDVSFFRYMLEGFMQAIYSYDRADLLCREDFCYYKSPKKFLKDFDMYGDRFGADVVALLIFIVVLKVLFYFSLILRIKRVQ